MNSRPGMISYQMRSSGATVFARPDTIDRVALFEGQTIIRFADGHCDEVAEKPFVIAEKIKATEGAASTAEKPAHQPSTGYRTASGKSFEITRSPNLTAAFLNLNGEPSGTGSHTLSVIADGPRGAEKNYIQYRDGTNRIYPRFAMSVDSEGKAEVQVLTHGEDPEAKRLRYISLEKLIDLVERRPSLDKPPAQ